MKRLWSYLLTLVVVVLTACNGIDRPFEGTYDQVIIYYGMGYNNLASNLKQNLRDLERDVLPELRHDKAIVAFLHTPASYSDYYTPNPPVLVRIYRGPNGKPVRDTLKTYPEMTVSASAESMRRVMNEIQEMFPARRYGMVVSSHGSGWLPKNYKDNSSTGISLSSVGVQYVGNKVRWLELPELASAIPYHLNFLILDCCLCGGIEVAWALKDVTDRLIASPTEILVDGMGYSILSWDVFAHEEPDFITYCEQYYDYYKVRQGGTIVYVDCHQLEPLAEAWRDILEAHRSALNYYKLSNSVQRYYYPDASLVYFYDLRDFAVQLGATESELARLDAALAAAVPAHRETASFKGLKLERCCGLSTYIPDPARPTLNAYYRTLGWNRAVGLIK